MDSPDSIPAIEHGRLEKLLCTRGHIVRYSNIEIQAEKATVVTKTRSGAGHCE